MNNTQVNVIDDTIKRIGRITSFQSTDGEPRVQYNIIEWLQDLSPSFERINGELITENQYKQLKTIHSQWIQYLIDNYYASVMNVSRRLSESGRDLGIFFGNTATEVLRKEADGDDDRIQSGLYDNCGMHIWIETINFFRIFREYSIKNKVYEKDIPMNSINEIIKKVMSEWKVNTLDEKGKVVPGFNKKEMIERINMWYGGFAIKFVDTQHGCDDSKYLEDATEFEDEQGISYAYVAQQQIGLERVIRDERAPSPHDIFSSMYFYMNCMLALDITRLGFGEVTMLDPVDNSVDEMLLSWIRKNSRRTTDVIIDQTERLLYNLSTFGGLKDVHIYSELFGSDEVSMRKKAEILMTRPRRQRGALIKYQLKLSEELGKFNPLNDDLTYYFKTEIIEYAENYKMAIWALLINELMKYSQFIPRFIVNGEMCLRSREEIKSNSLKEIMFIKVDPYAWYFLDEGKLYGGTIQSILEWWMKNHAEIGIPAIKGLNGYNWFFTWQSYYKGIVNEEEFVNKTHILKVIPTRTYRAKEDPSNILNPNDNVQLEYHDITAKDYLEKMMEGLVLDQPEEEEDFQPIKKFRV